MPQTICAAHPDSSHGRLASPNLLAAKANQSVRAAQVIVGDTTYLPLCGGRWCYLAVWQDKYYAAHCWMGGFGADDRRAGG